MTKPIFIKMNLKQMKTLKVLASVFIITSLSCKQIIIKKDTVSKVSILEIPVMETSKESSLSKIWNTIRIKT